MKNIIIIKKYIIYKFMVERIDFYSDDEYEYALQQEQEEFNYFKEIEEKRAIEEGILDNKTIQR